jgi:thiamine-phosphate pyrophosphorylase
MFDTAILRLVAVTDSTAGTPAELLDACQRAVTGGATMVQLRLKGADSATLLEAARVLVSGLAVPVIVNDRTDVALAAGAAGVHLGPDDPPVSAIRQMVPPGFIIGASVGLEGEVPNSRDADYIGIGPAFSSTSKADAGSAIGSIGIRHYARLCGKPAVAIGGITTENIALLTDSTAVGVAVINGLFGQEDIAGAARQLRNAVDLWSLPAPGAQRMQARND